MLGLILIYFAGKAFYDLAGRYGKNQWLFGILGVVLYHAGLFLGGILIALFYELVLEKSIDSVNEFLLSLLAVPIGILVCWGFYNYLLNRWDYEDKPQAQAGSSDVLDADLLNRNSETL